MSDDSLSGSPKHGYEEAYRAIADSLTRGDIGLLIGAGMSADSEISTGSEMAKRMLRRAVLGAEREDETHPVIDEIAPTYPFEAIAEYMTGKLPYEDFGRWLRDKAGFERSKPKEAHKALFEIWALLGHRFPKVIFTTNFDNLIEDQFGDEAKCITAANLIELPEAREKGKIVIVHLHGSIKYPNSLVYGERRQATLEGPLFDLLRAALATDIFVLVGYSLTDTNLRNVFFDVQRVIETRQGLRKRTFAVSPADGDPFDSRTKAGIAREIWLRRGVEHIAVGAVEFFKSLSEATDHLVMVKMRERVANALGIERETLDQMLESAARPFKVIEPKDLLMYLYYTLTP